MISSVLVGNELQRPPSTTARIPVARLAIWFFLTRAAVWIVAGLAIALIPRGPFAFHTNLVEWLYHWDAGWYYSIIHRGYYYSATSQSNAAFFPLYPLLAAGLAKVVPNVLLSGYLISNGFLFGSCLLLWKLVVRDYRNTALADRSALFLLLCPVTVFYSSFFTESQFIFFALSVAYLAGEKRWLSAGGCAFLAALTRPPGALLVVIILFEYGRRLKERRESALPAFRPFEALSVLVAALLPLSALLGFGYYLFLTFHDSKVLFHVHNGWNQHMVPPWYLFISWVGYDGFYLCWFEGALVLAFTLTVLGFRYRMRPSHLAFLSVFLLLYSTNSLLEAIPRYLSVLFPLYIAAGEVCLRYPRWERWAYGVSGVLAIVGVVLFADGYWFT